MKFFSLSCCLSPDRRMEGEKETAEEKEEDQHHHHVGAAASVGCQDLPIMHWEDLSQRIAELEQQEQERREGAKVSYDCWCFLDDLDQGWILWVCL